MKIKTLQWNIGGGKIRKEDSISTDPLLYREEGVEYICENIKKHNPDIITLQETHESDFNKQVEFIAKKTWYKYFVNDVYDKSHIEVGQGLGQAILSKFPIKDHSFKFFPNPKFQKLGPDGNMWTSHDKGITKCEIEIEPGNTIELGATHFIPFRWFGVDTLDEKYSGLMNDISDLIASSKDKYILQGDLNLDGKSLKNFLPRLFTFGVLEIELADVTTPKQRFYDHVLYKGVRPIKQEIFSDVLTDHYPVITEFEI